MRLVETDAGALVIDESTFLTSEVNVSGYIILRHCIGGAALDQIAEAFAGEADCSFDEAHEVIEMFLGAARGEGWVDVTATIGWDESSDSRDA